MDLTTRYQGREVAFYVQTITALPRYWSCMLIKKIGAIPKTYTLDGVGRWVTHCERAYEIRTRIDHNSPNEIVGPVSSLLGRKENDRKDTRQGNHIRLENQPAICLRLSRNGGLIITS